MTATVDSDADRSASVSGNTLRYARQRAGLSLSAAAARAGVSRSSLSAYERGTRTPSLDRLFGILESLGFAVRIELSPRVRERNGVPRGEELVEVIRLAEQYPRRHRPEVSFLSILRGAGAKVGSPTTNAEKPGRYS